MARTRADLELRKQAVPAGRLPAAPEGAGASPRFESALRAPGLGVIAEFKRRSPSAGTLREGADLHELLGAYERGGAVAFSVLTDEPHFDGSPAGPARGPQRARAAGPAQGLHRRPLPATGGAARRAPTRCC